MSEIKNFDLDDLLERIEQIRVDSFEHLSEVELEWVLLDFVSNWGKRLLLNPQDWPPEADREKQVTRGAIIAFPFSSAQDFPLVNSQQVRILGLSAAILDLYIMLLDAIVDEPHTVPVAAKLALPPLMMHYHRLMHQIFPADSVFWNRAAYLLNLTFRTMRDEQELHSKTIHPYSFDEFKRIAYGKMAFIKINCHALSILNNDPRERIDALAKCFDILGLTLTIRDDIRDWQVDYMNKNYTYLLMQLLYSEFKADIEENHLPEPSILGSVLLYSDLIENLYELTVTQLKETERLASEIGCPNLAHVIRRTKKLTFTLSENLFNSKLAAIIGINSYKI